MFGQKKKNNNRSETGKTFETMEGKIEYIITLLTETNGSHAVGESNVKDAVDELRELLQEATRLRAQNERLLEALKMVWRDCSNAAALNNDETYDAIRKETFKAVITAITEAAIEKAEKNIVEKSALFQK